MSDFEKYVSLLQEKQELLHQFVMRQNVQLKLLTESVALLTQLRNFDAKRIKELETQVASFKKPTLHTNN